MSFCHLYCQQAIYVLFSLQQRLTPKAKLLPIWLLAADPDAEAVFRKDAPGRRSDLGHTSMIFRGRIMSHEPAKSKSFISSRILQTYSHLVLIAVGTP